MKGSKEPKTRFVCTLPNQDSELFSIKKRNNGGLILSIKYAPHYMSDEIYPESSKIVNQKYSIHPSNNGTAATIHHTIKFDNNQELDSCTFQRDALNLCAPLFVKICGRLNSPLYGANIKAGDKVVSLAKIGDPCTIFIFGTMVSGKNISLDAKDFPGLSFCSENLGELQLNIIFGHILVPAIGQGTLTHFKTNSVRKNKCFVEPDMRDAPPISLSLGKKAASAALLTMIYNTVLIHARKIRDNLGEREFNAMPSEFDILSKTIFANNHAYK